MDAIPKFDVNRPQSFAKWFESFECVFSNRWYDVQLQYPSKDREKVTTENGMRFLHRHFREAIGSEGRDFIKAQVETKVPADKKEDYMAIKDYLLQNCIPKRSYVKTIGDLITYTQKDDESLGEFTNRVRGYAQRVSTTDKEFLEQLTLTVILYGLREQDQVNKVLLLDKMPGLEEAVQMLRTHEAILEATRAKIKSEGEVDKVGGHRDQKKTSKGKYWNRDKPRGGNDNKRCTYCGWSHAPGRCPAYNKPCNKCKRLGHFSSVCRSGNSGNRRNVNPVDEDDDERQEYADEDTGDQAAGKEFMGEVTTVNSVGTTSSSWTLKARLGSKRGSAAAAMPVDFKIDTGAAVNCIPFSMYDRKRWGPLEPPEIKLLGAAETKLATEGVATLRLFYKDRVVLDRF